MKGVAVVAALGEGREAADPVAGLVVVASVAGEGAAVASAGEVAVAPEGVAGWTVRRWSAG